MSSFKATANLEARGLRARLLAVSREDAPAMPDQAIASRQDVDDAVAGITDRYLGTWNANTNSPALASGVGAAGDTYDVSVAGTQNITGAAVAFAVGDRVRFVASGPPRWVRVPATGGVTSVNGQTGPATVDKASLGLSAVENIAPIDMPVSLAAEAALNAQAVEIGKRAVFFPTRAALLAALLVLAPGAQVCDGKVSYIKDGGTSISDMAGFSPLGDISLLHYAVDGAGGADNTARINAALAFAAGKTIYFPKPAVAYNVSGTLNIAANTRIVGPGKYVPCLRGTGSSSNHVLAINNVTGVEVRDLMIDGNKASRLAGGNGGNGILLRSTNCKIINCNIINNPNAGILSTGATYTCSGNLIEGCDVIGNAGVGISQYQVSNTTIVRCFLRDSGLENITKDGASDYISVLNCKLGRHFGGCGNIGWDGGFNSIVSNCYIDNEDDTTASAQYRNCICLNSHDFATLQYLISNNVLMGYRNYGVRCRNRTGEGFFKAGRGFIVGNIFKAGTGATADVSVEATDHQVVITPNQWDKGWSVVDTDPSKVIVPYRFDENLSVSKFGQNEDAYISAIADAGKIAGYRFYNGSTVGFDITKNTAALSGGNNGGDLEIRRFADDGTFLGVALQITRGTGRVQFEESIRPRTPGASSQNIGTSNFEWNAGYFSNLLRLNAAAAGSTVQHRFAVAGAARIDIRKNAATESGANAGSDLEVVTYDDAGNQLGIPLTIIRGTGAMQFDGSVIRPVTDNVRHLGDSGRRWAQSHVARRHWTATVFDASGSGSPEGALVAGIGSTYRRLDGGAGTCSYIKESGTGNVGWVAK